MKKILTVVTSFATLILFGAANAQSLTAPSGTSLEGLSTGEKTFAALVDYDDNGTDQGSLYWFTTVAEGTELYTNEVIATVKEYDPSGYDVPVTNRTAQWADDNNAKYLAVDSSNELLYRTIKPKQATLADENAQVAIGDGIYLDTLVQFTAADKAFEAGDIAAGDKIAISYVERDADSVDEGEDPYTNFVVRAGYVVGSSIVATNYYLTFPGDPANEVKFDKAGWHRLTVRAISNVTKDEYPNAPVGFVVYVDGTNLVYTAESVGCKAAGDSAYVGSLNSVVSTYLYNNEKQALLPSLLSSGDDNYNTLSAVGFKGNGSVDDISFTANKPGILPVEGMTVTIAWDANVASYTVDAGETTLIDGEVVSGAGSTNLLLAAEVTAITVTATYAEGYEAGTWTATAGTLNNGAWTDLEGGATLTINSMLPLFDVGGVHYGSFAAALEAAVSAVGPATIKLLDDINEGISFTAGEIVLDLNGKTIQGGASDMYTINNFGAELLIIDSATGGIVAAPLYTGAEDSGALYTESSELTTINAGRFESIVYTPKLQDPEETNGNIVINGGSFYDPDYESESKFYLAEYLGVGAKISYSEEYVTVGEPIIGTYTVTVTPTENATYAVTGAASNEGDVYTVATGHSITITATPNSGYEYAEEPTGWTLSEGVITIEVSAADTVAIPAPTAKQIIGTYEVVVTPNANATYAAICTNDDSAVVFNENITTVRVGYAIMITATPNENYEYATTPDGWTAGENGVITKVVDVAGTVAIPAPTATGSYPTYITGHDDYKDEYDTWAQTYGADTASAYEAAFLLNIAPDAEDQTLKPTAITMEGGKVVITANQTLTSVNGKVYVKVATTLAGLSTAEWAEATLSEGKVQVTPGSSDTAGFYKIKVDF